MKTTFITSIPDIVIAIFAIGLIFAVWVTYCEVKYQRFQNRMKPGDKCSFYIGEERKCGYIKSVCGNLAVCSNYAEIYTVFKTDIYPL